MSDPLAEVIAMLNLRAVLTKTIEGAGDWRVRRSDQGLSFYGVVLEGGCRLEIDQHEPQILRAGDFILIPAAYRFSLTSLTPPPSPALETIPVQLAEGHFRLGALDKPAQMQALIGHCASGITGKSYAERAGRAIADALGDIRNADARLAQPLHGQGHSPA